MYRRELHCARPLAGNSPGCITRNLRTIGAVSPEIRALHRGDTPRNMGYTFDVVEPSVFVRRYDVMSLDAAATLAEGFFKTFAPAPPQLGGLGEWAATPPQFWVRTRVQPTPPPPFFNK